MGKKTKELTIDDFIVKLDKQAWEVREVMEQDLGIERMTKLEVLKDKAEDKSLWTGFTSWNQNRLNDSSDTETIQALVNSLLQEL